MHVGGNWSYYRAMFLSSVLLYPAILNLHCVVCGIKKMFFSLRKVIVVAYPADHLGITRFHLQIKGYKRDFGSNVYNFAGCTNILVASFRVTAARSTISSMLTSSSANECVNS